MKCIAAGILGGMEDAEDTVQQAYSIAIEKNQSFDERDKFLGWLAGIVKNCALNNRRKFVRRKTSSVDPASIESFVEARITNAAASNFVSKNTSSLQESFDDEVLKALRNVPMDARTCLLLKVVEGLTYKEISVLMKIPAGTVMSMVHRGRISMRSALKNHEFARPVDDEDRQ